MIVDIRHNGQIVNFNIACFEKDEGKLLQVSGIPVHIEGLDGIFNLIFIHQVLVLRYLI